MLSSLEKIIMMLIVEKKQAIKISKQKNFHRILVKLDLQKKFIYCQLLIIMLKPVLVGSLATMTNTELVNNKLD